MAVGVVLNWAFARVQLVPFLSVLCSSKLSVKLCSKIKMY